MYILLFCKQSVFIYIISFNPFNDPILKKKKKDHQKFGNLSVVTHQKLVVQSLKIEIHRLSQCFLCSCLKA